MPTALITGGHSGIGFSAARELTTRYKWDIVLAGRSPDAMKEAAEELRRTSGTRVTLLNMDTSSLESVRGAADHFTTMLDNGEIASLDALLCNAGGRFDGAVSYSKEGHERTFATNCLGHFLLVDLLADRMVDTGRIVFTASGTHDPDTMDGKMVGRVLEPDADMLVRIGKDGGKAVSAGKRYSTSKLCTILNAYELHRRLRKAGRPLTSIAFDPGSVAETGFLRGMPAPVRWLARTAFLKWVLQRRGITMGSVGFSGASLARIAADPAFAGGSGKYFQCNDGKLAETRSSTLSYDDRRAARLWEQMERLVRLPPA